MAQRKLRLMISSRCRTKFPIGDAKGIELSEIRKQLKKEIEAETFFGTSLVTVWINEEETESGSKAAWEACVDQASDCDIFIALLDGDAGWQKDKSGIGICHAEFEAAHAKSPAKVRAISLLGSKRRAKPKPGPDRDFADAISRAGLLDARNIKDETALIHRTKNVVRELVLQLSHVGAREVKRSGTNTGQALEWSRLTFSERQREMIDALTSSLESKNRARIIGNVVSISVAKRQVLFQPSAIPAAFTVPAAREMVGQPFLGDHKLSASMEADGGGGPVHIIACQKNITEAQAMSLLGFPDATIVSGSFGVYVADNTQKIQLCLISNCRDVASTKHGLQKLFEWLERTGEDAHLATRAASRARILKAIAGELE